MAPYLDPIEKELKYLNRYGFSVPDIITFPRTLIKILFAKNPCKKCLVLPCCKFLCKDGKIYVRKARDFHVMKMVIGYRTREFFRFILKA